MLDRGEKLDQVGGTGMGKRRAAALPASCPRRAASEGCAPVPPPCRTPPLPTFAHLTHLQLVDKSADLSMASQLFYKQARKANSCCRFM